MPCLWNTYDYVKTLVPEASIVGSNYVDTGSRYLRQNLYELLNLRAFNISTCCIKIVSFNVWVRCFEWNFKGTLWNSTQNILPIHGKICNLFNCENWRALRYKSSYAFLEHPLLHDLCLKIKQPESSMRRYQRIYCIIYTTGYDEQFNSAHENETSRTFKHHMVSSQCVACSYGENISLSQCKKGVSKRVSILTLNHQYIVVIFIDFVG